MKYSTDLQRIVNLSLTPWTSVNRERIVIVMKRNEQTERFVS